MAVLNKKYRFVFIAEPHTGSRSVRNALLELDGSQETNGDHHLTLEGCVRKGFITESESVQFNTFSTIRNPYDLLVTRWWYHARKFYSFNEWIKDFAAKEQEGGTLFWRSRDVHYLLRYEHLDLALNMLLVNQKIPWVNLNHTGKTIGKPNWQEMWDYELVRLSKLRFPDIERYGYQLKWDKSIIDNNQLIHIRG